MAELAVVYVWDADYPWDVRTEKTCLALSAAGHRVHIVARNRKLLPTIANLPEGTVHRMRPWGWAGRFDDPLSFPAFFSPRWRSLIANVCSEVGADLVIARDLPLCPAAIAVGHRLKLPVILDMAEHYPAMMRAIRDTGQSRPMDWLIRNPALVGRVERYCISAANHILVVADEMKDRLSAMGVNRARITRVSNTPSIVGPRVPTRPLRKENEPIRLVYLGLLEVVRGINELIEAVAILRTANTRVKLLLIGTGRDERVFRARVASLGLTAHDVEFAGYLPYAVAMKKVAEADIGVLPLHRNAHMDTTVPNKLFDYMSVGIPVITSDTIPSARIVHAEGAGVVFRAQDASDLATAVASLCSEDARRKMGERGRAAVERIYNWKHDSQELLRAVQVVRSDWIRLSGSRHQT